MQSKKIQMALLNSNRPEAQGEITAFLSLILLLILALVGTTIEAARVNAARGFSERALEMAMDSVFTQYGRTLFEDYHVFFLEQGIGTEENLIAQLENYMSYTFEPNKNLSVPGTDYPLANVNLWGIKTEKVTLEKLVYATDYQGNLFRNQAVDYMKYRTTTEQMEKLLGYRESIKQTSKTSAIVEEKLKVEESMGELNQYMVQCIQQIEGISFGKNGIQYTKSGIIKTEESFVKQFCPTTITSSNLGINNALVWNSLKEKYRNPVDMLTSMKEAIKNVKQKMAEQTNLLEQIRKARESKETAKSKKAKVALDRSINEFQKEYDSMEEELEKNISYVKEQQSYLIELSANIQPKIDQVLGLLPQMDQKQESIRRELAEYKTHLQESQEEMLPDVYEELQKEAGDMGQYVGKESNKDTGSFVYCIQQMKPVLQSNRSILEGCSALGKISVNKDNGEWDGLLREINIQIDAFRQYQVKPLVFDYSSLKVKEQVPNPITSLNNVLGEGILNLVIPDKSTLSEKKLENPDNLYKLNQSKDSQEVEQNSTGFETALEESEEEGYSSEITQSFGAFGNNTSLFGVLGETGGQLGTSFLWSEYLDSHCKDYRNTMEGQDGKKSALTYEKEYILSGKATDQENLQEVVNRLVSLRCILNFLSILGDSKKGEMAYATAAALVGYTCMEPLVRLTQILILTVWALEEALIDTAAILEGKTVPFMKNKTEFLVKYEDLVLVNKAFIQEKASKLPEKGSGLISFGYQDYIKLFLWMEKPEKQTYRAMDIVQENMKIRYRKDFDIGQCLYGIQTKAQWQIPSKFIRLVFVRQVLKEKTDGWSIQVIKEYSY